MFQALLNFLTSLLLQNTPPVAPIPPPVVPEPAVITKATLLDLMCKAIESREGSIAPCPRFPTGTPAWRNHNPGNLRYAGQAGSTGKDANGFAIFATYQLGYEALRNQILLVAKGKSKVYPNPCTLAQFFAVYSPSTDGNDPTSYALEVAGKMKVSISFPLSRLV